MTAPAPSQEFAGTVTLVTGAASGIGAASARRFAAAGATVAILDVDLQGAQSVSAELTAQGYRAHAFECDVADDDSVERAVAAVAERLGPISAAHVNASIMIPGGDALAIPVEHWDRTFAINCRGAFMTARAVLRNMVVTGTRGSLCFTGSDTALRTSRACPAYLSTKHAVIGIARSIAVDFGGLGIRSNIVTPGVTETPGLHDLYSSEGRNPQEVMDFHAKLSVLGRIAQPDDLAEAVVYLCSSRAQFITGANLVVDGGMTIRYDAE
ncbi:Short-chain dehydrogenase [Mycobacterium sp. smrl_JER01]